MRTLATHKFIPKIQFLRFRDRLKLIILYKDVKFELREWT